MIDFFGTEKWLKIRIFQSLVGLLNFLIVLYIKKRLWRIFHQLSKLYFSLDGWMPSLKFKSWTYSTQGHHNFSFLTILMLECMDPSRGKSVINVVMKQQKIDLFLDFTSLGSKSWTINDQGHDGWQGLAWILQSRRRQRRHGADVAPTVAALPAKNWPWRPW